MRLGVLRPVGPRKTARELERLGIAIVSILAAVALVTATSAAMDAVTVGLKESIAYTIPVDLIGKDSVNEALVDEGHAEQVVAAVESVEEIEDVKPMVAFPSTHALNAAGEYAPFYVGNTEAVLFLPDSGGSALDAYRIIGGIPVSGTCAVARQMADDIGISVGDQITLLFYVYEASYDPATGTYESISADFTMDFTVSEIWTQERGGEQVVYFEDGSSQWYGGLSPDSVAVREHVNPVVMNMADLTTVFSQLPYGPLRDHYFDDSESLYLMWVDRGPLLDTLGVSDDIESLDTLRARLTGLDSVDGFTVQRSDLAWALESDISGLEDSRMYILAFCIPGIAATFYLASTAANLYIESVRDRMCATGRESCAFMRSRAAGAATVTGLGLILTGAGLVAGFLLSILLRDSVALYATWGAPAALASEPTFGPLTIALALTTGTAGAVLAFLPPVRRLVGREGSSSTDMRRSRPLRSPAIEASLLAASLLGFAFIGSGFRLYLPDDPVHYSLTLDAARTVTTAVIIGATPALLALGTVGILLKSRLELHSRLASWMISRAPSRESTRTGHDQVFDGRRATTIAAIASLAVATAVIASCGLDSYAVIRGEDRASYQTLEGMDDLLTCSCLVTIACSFVAVGLLSTRNSVRRRISWNGKAPGQTELAHVSKVVFANSTSSTMIGVLIGAVAGLVGTLTLAMVLSPPLEHIDYGLLYEPIVTGILGWVLPTVFMVVIGGALVARIAAYRHSE